MSEELSEEPAEFEALVSEWRRQQPLNAMAFAPLAVGLLGGVLWLFSAVLGLLAVPVALAVGVVALITIRRRGERGRIVAWAGMAVAVVVAVSMTFAERSAVQARQGPPAGIDLAVHDCFDAQVASVVLVDRLSCTEMHSGEVFEVVTLPAGPQPTGLYDTGMARCATDAAKSFPAVLSHPGAQARVIVPDETAWARGGQRYVCYLFFAPGVDRPAAVLR